MNDLTAFQRDLLRTIGGMEKPIGLEVKDKMEEYYQKEINHGRLYPNLDELETMGLIRKEELDGRTNTYSITRRGRQEIMARDEWNSVNAPENASKNLKAEA